MNDKRWKQIVAQAALHGLTVKSNRPGDGVRRYYFVLENGQSDGGILQLSGPLKGPDIAEAWLQGFACRDSHSNKPRRKS